MIAEIAAIASRYDLPQECQRDIAELVLHASADRSPDGSIIAEAMGDEHRSVALDSAYLDADIDSGSSLEASESSEFAQLLAAVAAMPDDPGSRPRRQKAALAAAGGPATLSRYTDLGRIGVGGMGEVRRVRDPELNRTMAMKIISPALALDEHALARFLEEAQATAQLQHPGIVPVHELGRLADGRFYFTMQEIRGRDLSKVIRDVHDVSANGWATTENGWHFRRLIGAFQQVCAAVAYAHSMGVVHRDLKPRNVMLGEFGEALVVDWGLAKVLGRPDLAADAGDLDVVVTDRSQGHAGGTRAGTVAGTPAYMPPEQARGEIDSIDARSDIYSLGAMLYEVLTGRPPYEGPDGRAVLRQVLRGPPQHPVGEAGPFGVTSSVGVAPENGTSSAAVGPIPPDDLVDICKRAMARESADRYGDASELANEILAWLDGAKQREKALTILENADEALVEAHELRLRAQHLKTEAESLLQDVEPWEAEEAKAPGWSKEDDAATLEGAADMKEIEHREALHTALNYSPDLPEGHERLAQLWRRQHAAAEERRDARSAAQSEALLRHHDRTGAHAAYLEGVGALTLVTDPPGAEVILHRYETRNHRLVAVPVRSLGTTPLVQVPMEMGSYLCLIRAKGRAEVRYPVFIHRGAHWSGVRPGDSDPYPIELPRREDLVSTDCYVPAGWFWSGRDPGAFTPTPRRRLWVDAVVFETFPVTNRQYIAFLDDLVAQGREEEAMRWAPRERGPAEEGLGTVIYGRTADGGFALRPDADGDIWCLDWPVMMVDWWCAVAYAKWRTERTGASWRLPMELEWEKAARGVDGRYHPWGDKGDPSWCCMKSSHRGKRLPVVVDSYPVDESPYGVRGMAGNIRDWTGDIFAPDGPPLLLDDRLVDCHAVARGPVDRVVRGGGYSGAFRNARAASRMTISPSFRFPTIGFRLSRSIRDATPSPRQA